MKDAKSLSAHYSFSSFISHPLPEFISRNLFLIVVLGTLSMCASSVASAQPNVNGETGYINMPSGRIENDGIFRIGYSVSEPYASLWSSISFLPRLELNARYVRIMTGNIWNGNPNWQGYGDYKDKVASGKFILMNEDRNMPTLAIGINDIQGTGLFKSQYLAANKRLGALDATFGVGKGRINGAFAGARYTPKSWSGIALVAEYDANDYPHDPFSNTTHIAQRKKGIGLALEYQWGWLGSQLSYRDGKPGINIHVSIPLENREYIPKIDEPSADTELVARPTLKQWHNNKMYQQDLTARLLEQDFKNIHVHASGNTLETTLTNTRISLASRAVGRAARSIILRAPQEVREIKINYTIKDMPFATYTFTDSNQLDRYFKGLESRKQLAPIVAIDYADPLQTETTSEIQNDLSVEYSTSHLDSSEGDIVSFRSENEKLDKVRIAPGLGFYFNDPSGALRYETFVNASYEKQMMESVFFKTATQLTLLQDVDGVRQASNSLLPHVRTDVADYKKDGNFKLTQALLNKYYHPLKRLYIRSSAGLYEEMFGGIGGQMLYFPENSPWAFDISVDALRQRDIGGWLTFRNYSTVTALATLRYHYQPTALSVAIRAGRFLARDQGARIEMKRRFLSGFDVGAWYTLTNGNDTTNPGSPANPYHDKGVFISISLSSMLTQDSHARPKIILSPWTRDVGQMVISPDDLYDLLEPAYINLHDHDGLQYFGDLDDSYD